MLELIRPIPILAWVPLAILMFPRGEQPVIFLTFLSAFFVMTLNTVLGVQSVDRDLVRAARCLGASPARRPAHGRRPGGAALRDRPG